MTVSWSWEQVMQGLHVEQYKSRRWQCLPSYSPWRDNREVITLHAAGYLHLTSLSAGTGCCQSINESTVDVDCSAETQQVWLKARDGRWKGFWPGTWASLGAVDWCVMLTLAPLRFCFFVFFALGAFIVIWCVKGSGLECALIAALSRRSRFLPTPQRKRRSPASQPQTHGRQAGEIPAQDHCFECGYSISRSEPGTAAELWHISPLFLHPECACVDHKLWPSRTCFDRVYSLDSSFIGNFSFCVSFSLEEIVSNDD